MAKNPNEGTLHVPDPPEQPPLFVMYESPDDHGVVRFEISESDIVRAHRAVQRLFDRGVRRVWIVRGIQEIVRPDPT